MLSDFAKGESQTLARLKATSPDLIAVSSITAMEIEFGIALDEKRARRLAPIMHALLGAVTVLPYDIADARATATSHGALQKKGRPIGAYDVLIAGCALARGFVLITSSEREFSLV